MKVICKVVFEATIKGEKRSMHRTTTEINFYDIGSTYDFANYDITYRFVIQKFSKHKENRILIYQSENKPFQKCSMEKQKKERVAWSAVSFAFNHYTGEIYIDSNIAKI